MLQRPLVEVVGSPDLPRSVEDLFGPLTLGAHLRISTPDGRLIGYRVTHSVEGRPWFANVLVTDDGEAFSLDADEEATESVPETVPCRTDYHVCPDCLHELRAHAYVIEGESGEDRPHPSTEDAWDQVEGCAGFCGGDHCANPPQRVVWTREGHTSIRDFESTTEAARMIAGIVAWGDILLDALAGNELPAEEVIERYEALDSHESGEFRRYDLDPRTGRPRSDEPVPGPSPMWG